MTNIPVGTAVRSHDFFMMTHSYVEGVIVEGGIPGFHTIRATRRVLDNEEVALEEEFYHFPISTILEWKGRILVKGWYPLGTI